MTVSLELQRTNCMQLFGLAVPLGREMLPARQWIKSESLLGGVLARGGFIPTVSRNILLCAIEPVPFGLSCRESL